MTRSWIDHAAPSTCDMRAAIHWAAGEINRELAIIRRMFRMAMQDGKLLQRPHIPMLREDNVRRGFFERAEFEAVRSHLPGHVQALVTFAYFTGWRWFDELLPMQLAQIDLHASIVRLDISKNAVGAVIELAGCPILSHSARHPAASCPARCVGHAKGSTKLGR